MAKLIGALAVATVLLVTAAVVAYLLPCRWFDDATWCTSVETKVERFVRERVRPLLPDVLITPDLDKLDERLAEHGSRLGAPVFIRIFKQEGDLELWLGKEREKRFSLFATYPICTWSGEPGPKQKTGDRQAPEGFYTVSRNQLNPTSRFHRAFNLGYPNAYDRAHKRTGGYLMVHGGCASRGCYAMTDPVISEIWKLVVAAFDAGQRRFHVHAFPFRMSNANMRAHSDNEWVEFWQELKAGYDLFEQTGLPPIISVCNGHYRTKSARENSNGSHSINSGC
jgi:murein L,D-transpeptidase YafK